MKIAILRGECSFTKGGAERYAANFCRELCEMGHEVWLLAEIFDPAVHPAIRHIPIKVNHATSAHRTRSFNANCQKALKGLQVDAVIALSRSYPADAFRVSDPLHRFWMEIRYPGKFHRFLQTLNPRHRAILEIEENILNPANTRMIITNSKLSKTLIREYYDYPEDRIHVVYNGVDHHQFTPDTSLRDKKTIELLFVGQDFKRKGLGPVIEALAAVRAAGFPCTLRVIGRDKPGPYVARANELGIADVISFEGPTRQVQDAYRAADLFVFPSLYDPFANVVLESLACGLPALTTNTNGSSEIITHGSDGFVVSGAAEGLADELTRAISSFCRMPAVERAAMRSRARAKAEEFTIGQNALKIVELLS